MNKLQIGELYSREEIHNIFENGITKFTPNAGTWGIQGIIKIRNRKNDYAFITTYGQDKLGQEFKEKIDENDIFVWKSQKKMDLKHPTIQNFINQNPYIDNFYLFSREHKNEKYKYQGKLLYLSHDIESNNPVIFKWKVIKNTEEYIENNGNNILKEEPEYYSTGYTPLTMTSPPSSFEDNYGVNKFEGKEQDFPALHENFKKIGLMGEKLVLDFIIEELSKNSRDDLIPFVFHTSLVEGDGAGYDIQSRDKHGNIEYIEVKTTTGGLNSDFFISRNELMFSEFAKDNYYLYRVYNLDIQTNTANCYIIQGSLTNQLNLNPISFSANYKH